MKLDESVDSDYFQKFKIVMNKYLPSSGEGDTIASQIVTAINKLVYKWYNDGDVYDNVNSGMEGWANDLTSYANWLYSHCDRAHKILDSIYNCYSDSEYENILRALADKCLNEDYLETKNSPKSGSIYDCPGPFEFREYSEEDDEDYLDESKNLKNEWFDPNVCDRCKKSLIGDDDIYEMDGLRYCHNCFPDVWDKENERRLAKQELDHEEEMNRIWDDMYKRQNKINDLEEATILALTGKLTETKKQIKK